ncbi:MAG: hypothetical protein KF819_31140 [Labilithrix sp.]|nr:hypothetical protein [Labilithrix sp.]
MGKKFNLPLLADAWGRPERSSTKTKKPSLDDARARLGGKTASDSPAPPGIVPGRVVALTTTSGAQIVAVVVHATATEAHVLVDGVRLRRVAPSALTLHDGDPPEDLAKIAVDARVFGTLSEGQPVRYADDAGALLGGKLVEKCRYGALIVRDDGAVIAVGFRKLWPGAPHGAA